MTYATTEAQEQTLIHIIRSLPPNRVEQLVDFAHFLEAQVIEQDLETDESEEEIAVDNDRWDALLASDESQKLLKKLADEALAEHRAGKTRPMKFTDEGRIVPG
ncbi:MAG: hypothetical protein KF753_15930 [Caldilineaceae bacterium]|nr:hypothetical protein [Caldilineaceae bacterium]